MMYARRRWRILLLAVCAAAGGCNAPEGSNAEAEVSRGKLVLTGSSTVAPLASEIGKRFEATHAGTRVDVQTGGSSRGIADARNGLADIGMASRALNEGENDLTAYVIARDGICMILHRDNPVDELGDEQIKALYRGQISNWASVGGEPRPVVVVNKAAGRSTLDLFLGHFGLRPEEIQASVIVGDNEQGVKTVAANPGAIGYVSIGTAQFDEENGAAIKLLPLGGIEPSVERVAAGEFPLSRPLNLVTRGEAAGLAREFIAYARSPEVADIMRGLFLVPVQ